MLIPRENPHLIGHDSALNFMLSAYHSNRFSHSWIFTGPQGIGKATFTFHLARYIFSGRKDSNLSFSPHDPLFRRIAVGSHGDLFTLGGESSISEHVLTRQEITVDMVRKANNFLNQTVVEGKWRIIIIDGVERLNRHSANALLKSLEEPPANTIFFLITQNCASILPTIRSRCQVLKLKTLTQPDVIKVVNLIEPEIKENILQKILPYAKGRPGKILKLYDIEGVEVYQQIQEAVLTVSDKGMPSTYDLLKTIGENEGYFDIFEDTLLTLTHSILRCVATQKFNGLNVQWQSFAKCYTLEQWINLCEKIKVLFQNHRQMHLDRKTALFCIFSSFDQMGQK